MTWFRNQRDKGVLIIQWTSSISKLQQLCSALTWLGLQYIFSLFFVLFVSLFSCVFLFYFQGTLHEPLLTTREGTPVSDWVLVIVWMSEPLIDWAKEEEKGYGFGEQDGEGQRPVGLLSFRLWVLWGGAWSLGIVEIRCSLHL